MTGRPLADLAADALVVTVEIAGRPLLDASGRTLLVTVAELPEPGPWRCCLVQGLTAIASVERVRIEPEVIPVVEVSAAPWTDAPRARTLEFEQALEDARAEALTAWGLYAAAYRGLGAVVDVMAERKLELEASRAEAAAALAALEAERAESAQLREENEKK